MLCGSSEAWAGQCCKQPCSNLVPRPAHGSLPQMADLGPLLQSCTPRCQSSISLHCAPLPQVAELQLLLYTHPVHCHS